MRSITPQPSRRCPNGGGTLRQSVQKQYFAIRLFPSISRSIAVTIAIIVLPSAEIEVVVERMRGNGYIMFSLIVWNESTRSFLLFCHSSPSRRAATARPGISNARPCGNHEMIDEYPAMSLFCKILNSLRGNVSWHLPLIFLNVGRSRTCSGTLAKSLY